MDEPPAKEGFVNPDNDLAQKPFRLLFPTRGLFPIGNIISVHGFLWSTNLNRPSLSNHVNFILVLFGNPQGDFPFSQACPIAREQANYLILLVR